MRFWDTSALVLLMAEQSGSAEADQWAAADRDMVLWTLAPVEAISAVQRLVRERALAEEEARLAEERLGELAQAAYLVSDVERVKQRAVRLLRVHALRAADALQLAAALLWSDDAPDGLVLHTLDRRLSLAARREGFRVLPE